MSIKKHIAANSDGLFAIINQILREKGISTNEFPLSVNKLSLKLPKTEDADIANIANIAADNLTERRCVEFKTKLIKMKDPHTGHTIVQMIEECVKWEDD